MEIETNCSFVKLIRIKFELNDLYKKIEGPTLISSICKQASFCFKNTRIAPIFYLITIQATQDN